jgi:MOSC domain
LTLREAPTDAPAGSKVAGPENPTKAELLAMAPGQIDTDRLSFRGLRGDQARHLDRSALLAALTELAPSPTDRGTVDLMVARGASGERLLPERAELSVEGGMPGDRWLGDKPDDPNYQLATTNTAVARTIANGQPLELHGDNLYLSLDITPVNLPIGSILQLGQARVRVTPTAHNGCKKWVQRFGLAAMKLNMEAEHRARRLRGIYLQVIEPGAVELGDAVVVLERPQG